MMPQIDKHSSFYGGFKSHFPYYLQLGDSTAGVSDALDTNVISAGV